MKKKTDCPEGDPDQNWRNLPELVLAQLGRIDPKMVRRVLAARPASLNGRQEQPTGGPEVKQLGDAECEQACHLLLRHLSPRIIERLHTVLATDSAIGPTKNAALLALPNRGVSVDLKLGYSCNDACIHCVVAEYQRLLARERRPSDRSTAECMDLLWRYRASGCDNVILTGGEPSMRADFVQLLRFAWELGYRITVQTNGRAFSRASIASQLDFGRDEIQFVIALHGPDAATHDAVTRRPGSYAQTARGIRALLAGGYSVMGKVVMSALNIGYLNRILDRFLSFGVCRGNIAFPHGSGLRRSEYPSVVPAYEEAARHVRECIQYQRSLGRKVVFDFEMMPLCFLDGHEEYNCELDQLGAPKTLIDQYAGPECDWSLLRPKLKTKLPQCAQCRYEAYCEGPWSDYPAHRGGSEFKPALGRKLGVVECLRIRQRRDRLLDRLPR
jgi:MoaA/NifB/PqqE/SkfB family radical SAM enzyme